MAAQNSLLRRLMCMATSAKRFRGEALVAPTPAAIPAIAGIAVVARAVAVR
jgi:hypothetical protein